MKTLQHNRKYHYLYRAIDAQGMTLDIWLRRKRDTQSAYAFFKRLLNQFGEPRVIVTDKAPSIQAAATIKGVETVHALYKKHRREGNLFGFSALNEIKNLLAT